jgi:hypothetical protein
MFFLKLQYLAGELSESSKFYVFFLAQSRGVIAEKKSFYRHNSVASNLADWGRNYSVPYIAHHPAPSFFCGLL